MKNFTPFYKFFSFFLIFLILEPIKKGRQTLDFTGFMRPVLKLKNITNFLLNFLKIAIFIN